jgi:electron transport complex protein RnfG
MTTPTQATNKVNIPVLAGALGLISAVATAGLVWVYMITAEPIKLQKVKATNAALMKVLPAFDNAPAESKIIVGKDKDGNTVVDLESKLKENKTLADLKETIVIFPATKDGKVVGFAGEGKSPLGFGGDVKAMVGLKADGSILVGIITGHQETPGLGTAITDRVRSKTIFDVLGMGEEVDESQLPPNATLDQFAGMTATNTPWSVKKDGGSVDFVSGATITSRAATDAFYKIASAYTLNKEKIAAVLAQ